MEGTTIEARDGVGEVTTGEIVCDDGPEPKKIVVDERENASGDGGVPLLA